MTDKELIQKILQAKRPLDIFDPGVKEIRKAYHEYAKIIHPDVCKEPEAQEA